MHLKLGTQLPYLKLGTQQSGSAPVAPVVTYSAAGRFALGTQLPYLRLGTQFLVSVPSDPIMPEEAVMYYGSTLLSAAHTMNSSSVLVGVTPKYVNL